MSLPIQHDAEACRFATELDGVEAELAYTLEGAVMTLDHTRVPEAIGGRGIAGELVRTALEHARAQGRKVVAACPYAAAYVQRHPEHADLLADA
ncbi:GNAT family N-acetyltransferase [Pseudoxanthomonas mexicana]|uniref:GNAT family N-acetyltransferase n=1 Tax=Pseudoxanthomonas mexicana TaxID=128785 RepID=UPI00398B1CA0